MATSSTFSYAQAAKGQSATPNATSTQQEPAVNGHAPESKDAPVSQDIPEAAAVRSESVEEPTRPVESSESVPTTQEAAGLTSTNAQNSNASLAGSRREDDDAATESSTRPSEKGAARSPSASTRVTDDNESKKGQRKGRKGKNGDSEKKGKEADKEKEKEKEQPKVELFEAPIPTVNIWAQRKEAQAAKTTVKPSTTAPAAARTDSLASGPQDSDPRKKVKAPESVAPASVQHNTVNGARTQKKSEAEGDASSRRNAPRGSRVGGALPPVGDAASWPTPETATKEEKPKSAEKNDKSEAQEDPNASKSRRREWERIEFVPTVNWETHIPAPRGTRGGRSGPGSRGGRDVPTRGGHNAATASTTTEKPADSPSAPAKAAGPEQREKRDGASNRVNSAAPAVAKAPSAESPRNEQRKSSAPTKASKPRDGGVPPSTEPAGPRGEGRGDRGRGGFRGRGGGGHGAGNAGHNQNFMANGTTFTPAAAGHRGGHFMSPPLPQGNSFQGHGSAQGRGGRGGNRGQSAGYRGNGPNGAARPRPLSTVSNFPPYQWDPNYAGMPMTAPPYSVPQPFNNDPTRAVLTQQIEFYFSLENLCKDQYLRRHMDGQGFVPLSFIRGFTRVSKLCAENPNILRIACADLTTVDFAVTSDGTELLRSRQHWPLFILPPDQREESAQTPGPGSVIFYNPDPQQMNGMLGGAYGVGPVPFMNGNGVDEPMPYMNGSHPGDGNGQLSAAVPEFQPGNINSPTNGQEGHEKAAGITASAHLPNGSDENSDAVKQPVNGIPSEFQPSETLQS